MFNHIYAIPVHREIGEHFLRDYFDEVSFANKKMNAEVPLVVFEDNVSCVNKKAIEEMKKEYPEVKVVYFSREDTVQAYNLIQTKLKDEHKRVFKKLYPNEHVNYGNVFNRIFIFAMLMQADRIHRRDSDILIDRSIHGEKVYPIENELHYLGKEIEGKIVYLCGGGYKGKYNLDIESLIEDGDYKLVRELFTCMSIPEAHHDDIINDEILGNNKPFEQDKVRFDSRDYPECGNISLYKLHRYFPSPVQDYILGSDYFFIDMAVHSKLHVTYHNRAVIHSYTTERKVNLRKVYNYWKGFLMLIDSQIFYRNYYEKFIDHKNYNEMNFETHIGEGVNDMEAFLTDFCENYMEQRKDKLLSCINLLRKAKDSQLKETADMLNNPEICTEILRLTEQSIKEHMELIKAWSDIAAVCDSIKDSREVMELLQKANL